ncbi:MAG: potassium channel family protein [Halieaceae bacterium]
MLITLLLTLSLLALCVTVHYEMLYRLGGFIDELAIGPRQAVVFGVMLAMAAHIIEIYIFAGGYYYALHYPAIGSFSGEAPVENFWDCVYLSFVTYSTLGFGDMVPVGWVRFMVGTEAVTGLVQIAWTASFLYYEMGRSWGHNDPRTKKR